MYGSQLTTIQQSLVDWMKTEHKMDLTGTAQLNLLLDGMNDDWAKILDEEFDTGDYLNTRDAVYGYPWVDEVNGPRVPRNLSAGGVAFFVGVAHTAANKTIYNR